jgi:SnoaL-like domain
VSDAGRLVDTEAIRDLTYRYALSVDRFRLDDVLSVYTDDAVLDLSSLGMPDSRARLRSASSTPAASRAWSTRSTRSRTI